MWDNPVFVREIRGKLRMRQARGMRVVIAIIVGLFVLWLYTEGASLLLRTYTTGGARDLFLAAFTMQAILLWTTAPAAAANAISQEREQQTWDLLLCSLLRPGEIIAGKLGARLLPPLAVLLLFVPFQLLCFLKGQPDLSFATIALCGLFLFVSAIFLVTTSLFCSFAFHRTPVAIACSYLIVLALTIGTAMLATALSSSFANPWDTNPVLWVNPVRIAAAAMSTSDDLAGSIVAFGLGFYALTSAFLLWRMVIKFRVFAVQ